MNEEIRQHKLAEIEEMKEKEIVPYPYNFDKKDNIKDVLERYRDLEISETLEDVSVTTAGRVMALRHHGKSSFFEIKDETGRIQAYIRKNEIGEEAFNNFKKYTSLGDFVGIEGFPFKTHTGELSIYIKSFQILTKAIRTLPEKWHGLKDKEIIYRQRYVEMLSNDEALKRVKMRFEMMKYIREFLNDRGFIEV
jgi:lysyl-tRNA synthetase class 2